YKLNTEDYARLKALQKNTKLSRRRYRKVEIPDQTGSSSNLVKKDFLSYLEGKNPHSNGNFLSQLPTRTGWN
ncbi:MAG: hypothetical protein KDD63_06710, partial [Bacteroidetes bacterium]|nr:hypothetical protein [Bacteroidota bacterium]